MQKNKPFFSIISCTKNREKFLPEMLASVSEQTFRDFEHIFIDGYSSDSTPKLISAYMKKINVSSQMFRQKPAGVSAAMNEGWKKAGGKYIIFLHDDDKFYSYDVLEQAHRILKLNPDVDLLYGKIKAIDSEGKTIGTFPKNRIFYHKSSLLLHLVNYLPHQAVFLKKEVFEKYGGFNEHYKYCMDYDLWLRISDKTIWHYTDRIISNYRVHTGSLTYNPVNNYAVNNELKSIQKQHTPVFFHPFVEISDVVIGWYAMRH